MRRLLPFVFCPLLFVMSMSAADARAAECRVVYVTGSTYYVDAGRSEGLRIGDELELLREDAAVGRLVVRHLAGSRAACDLVDGPAPAVGDLLRFTPSEAGTQRSTDGFAARTSGSFYGGITAQQQLYLDGSGFGEDIYRPALDAHIEGRSILGRPLDVLVDARAHRSIRSEGEDDGRSRVYRLEATWRFRDDRLRLRAGRQRQPALPSLGSFDGMSVEFGARDGLHYGLATGFQPEPGDLTPATDVFETAAFVQTAGRAGARRWNAAFAAVGSYESSEISREFLVLRGRYRDAGWMLSAVQELDVYRGWRADFESGSLGASSRYLSLRRRLHRRASLSVGFDSRRSVRIYRHRETPASEFDDSHRNGFWAAAQMGSWAGSNVSLRVRTRDGGGTGSMDSETLRIGRVPIYGAPLLLGLRATRYDNDFVEGWLGTLDLESRRDRVGGRAEFGLRVDDPKNAAIGDDEAWWLALEADYRLSRNWSTVLSWDHYGGADDSHDTIYSGLSYRFR